jgi:hypothetical protein
VRNNVGELQVACPCCERGLVDAVSRVCYRCGVAVPTSDPNMAYPDNDFGPNPDYVGPMTDAVRYKLDHAE